MNQCFQRLHLQLDIGSLATAAHQDGIAACSDGGDSCFSRCVVVGDRFHFEIVRDDHTLESKLLPQNRLHEFRRQGRR